MRLVKKHFYQNIMKKEEIENKLSIIQNLTIALIDNQKLITRKQAKNEQYYKFLNEKIAEIKSVLDKTK